MHNMHKRKALQALCLVWRVSTQRNMQTTIGSAAALLSRSRERHCRSATWGYPLISVKLPPRKASRDARQSQAPQNDLKAQGQLLPPTNTLRLLATPNNDINRPEDACMKRSSCQFPLPPGLSGAHSRCPRARLFDQPPRLRRELLPVRMA